MSPHRLLSVTEAADRLHVHPATVRRMIARGDLSAVRVGRVWRVDPLELEPQRMEVPGTPTKPGVRVVTGRLARLVQFGSPQTPAGR
jgi:excisionase family DNA binding protein